MSSKKVPNPYAVLGGDEIFSNDCHTEWLRVSLSEMPEYFKKGEKKRKLPYDLEKHWKFTTESCSKTLPMVIPCNGLPRSEQDAKNCKIQKMKVIAIV